MKRHTPEDVKREINEEVAREVLKKKYLSFTINQLGINEDLAGKKTSICCALTITNLEDKKIDYNIDGNGKGLVDALFNALTARLVDDCHSLANLCLEEFSVNVDEADLRKLRRTGRGTDAHVITSLRINNGNGKLIPFESRDQSMITSSVDVVRKTIEFFVNSERAVLCLKDLIEDAEKRNRSDLCERYTIMLSSLIYNTSYEKSLKEG